MRSESARASMTQVAFLGLGAMGRPMAHRLVDAGFDVCVYNRSPEPVLALEARGAKAFATPRDCVRSADVVITMLSDASALTAVLEGASGVFAAFVEGEKVDRRLRPVLVDMSTIGRATITRIARRAEEHGLDFVDAPVSGSVGPASRGELVALVGGSVRVVEHVRTVLDAMCRKVIHAGPVGQGQALKVVLNGLGAHQFVAFTSMLALGERAGLARGILLDAFTSGAFATPSIIGKRDKVLARDFSAEFSLALALKDCTLNAELQDELGLQLPVHRAIVEDVRAGVKEGLGDLDLFALEKHYARDDADE